MSDSPQVVFVHGAFVRDGAWWWAPVASSLAAAGVSSTAALLPSCGETGVAPTGAGPGLADDAAALAALLDSPCIVVGHSYGGMVATEAAAGTAATQLVYLTSYLPLVGESLAAIMADAGDPVPVSVSADGAVSVDGADDGTWFDERLLHDVSEPALVAGAHARMTAQSASVFGAPTTVASWQTIPSTYLVCAEDRSTAVSLQRAQAERAGAVVELATSHHPMLSRPDLLAQALLALL